jgi:hypothetical protein
MSAAPKKYPPPLSGAPLAAAVALAEAPLLGALVKRAFFTQLGLDQLDRIDLRVHRPQPWTRPALPSAAPDEELP